MENTKKIDISLGREIFESDFYHTFLKDELQKVIYENILKENQLHIFSSYIYENDYEIEAGVYIINSSENEIKINNLPLCIYNNGEKIYFEDLKVDKKLESYSSVFKEFKINKEKISEEYRIDTLSIGINDLRNIKKYPYINIDVNNLPKIKEYINYRDIKKFLANISIIDEDQLCIDIFRTGEIEEGLYIIALFRNSSNRTVNITSLPLEVYNASNLLMYKSSFTINDNSLNLEGNTGKMIVITIPRKDFPFIEGEDLTKYKVEIK